MKETLTKSLNMVVSERLLALLAEGAFVTTRHSSKRNRKLPELGRRVLNPDQTAQATSMAAAFPPLLVSRIPASTSFRVCLDSLAPRHPDFLLSQVSVQTCRTHQTQKRGLLMHLWWFR